MHAAQVVPVVARLAERGDRQYLTPMNRAALRDFALRARAEVESEKRAYWARLHRNQGGHSTLAISHALYEHVRRVRPDFPTERDRAEDLASHVAFKRLLDSASRALTLR